MISRVPAALGHALGIFAIVAVGSISPASGATIQTFGSGSAVSTIEASADFENRASLFPPYPYMEDGLAFSRVALSDNNNGCGYAGCEGPPWAGLAAFSGNYMYGVGGLDGYLLITTTGGQFFTGLEFLAGTGFSDNTHAVAQWQTFRLGVPVGTGTFTDLPSIVGFSDALGFDELRYTNFLNGQTAPAFDSVRAQFSDVQAIPEPASLLLLGTGVIGVMNKVRRRRT